LEFKGFINFYYLNYIGTSIKQQSIAAPRKYVKDILAKKITKMWKDINIAHNENQQRLGNSND